MRIDDIEPWWMQNILLYGNEGEADGGNTGDQPNAGETDEPDPDEETDDDLPDDKDVDGLKSALKKERGAAKTNAKQVRALEKQLRDAQKVIDEAANKDKSEAQLAKDNAEKAQKAMVKLAEGLKTTRVNSAIERMAREFKFKDVDDAISLVDRSLIEVEQDDDDPADIEIDAKSVKAAVKALADKKKHLIASDDDASGDPTGGTGYRRAPKGSKQASEDQLREKYPSLR